MIASSGATPAPHSENFTLQAFADPRAPLAQRLTAFAGALAHTREQGGVLTMREIRSSAGPTVQVADPASGALRELVMLGSNNYLGLTTHPTVLAAVQEALERYGAGCGGPPLLNGTTALHRRLEAELAALKGADDALLFSSGYAANLGWLSALLGPKDLLIYDELSHASLYDAMKLARCKARFFAHNDMGSLTARLEHARAQEPDMTIVVSVEGVYSMDGDLAPLREIRALCDRYGAWLMVDDAHGTGVMGESGAGTAEHFGVPVEIALGTFSKTFGTAGAFVAGSRELVSYLRYFARSHMFSAALPHLVVATVLGGLAVLRAEPERRARLHANARHLAGRLAEAGLPVSHESAILPLLKPAGVDLRRMNARIHALGVFANTVEAPAVPPEAERLRLSVMATHTPEQLDFAASVIARAAREAGFEAS